MTKLLPGQGANSDPQARIAGRCLDGTDGDEYAPVECFLGHPWRSQRGQWMGRRQFLQAGVSHLAPALRPRFGPGKNVWLLAVRSWGIFASVDRGRHWSLPSHIGGSSGSGLAANLQEMADGRILVVNSTHGNAPNGRVMGQFIRVNRKGRVSPAPPGPRR